MATRSRYYTHVDKFGDGTAYFKQGPGAAQRFYATDGTSWLSTQYWPEWVSHMVQLGLWKQISYTQARKLIKKGKYGNQ